MTASLAPVREGTSMKAILSAKHIEDLRGREDGEELIVISLLDLLQFQFHLITLLNKPLATGIIGRLNTTFLTHFSEYSTLLLLHLTKEREELGTLIGTKTSLLSDKLLHLSLELLRRELLGFICLTDRETNQENHHADKDFLHITLHFFTLSPFHLIL